MSAPFQSPSSLLDIRSALRRHWGKGMLFFLFAIGLTIGVAVLSPCKFSSEARMFVQLGRPSVRLDPTVTTGQTVSLNESRENEINSMLEVLRSRAMAKRVVDYVGADVVLGGGEEEAPGEQVAGFSLGPLLARLSELKYELHGIDPISDEERAIQKIQESIGIQTARRSNVFSISCEAKSPELAQKILGAFVEQYKEEHVRVNRTPGSHAFFQEQTARLETEMNATRDAIREAKNRMGLASIDGHREMLQSQLGTITGQLDIAASQHSGASARSAAYAQSLAKIDDRIVTREESGLPNVARDAMRQQLYTLELKERELLARLKESHPEVVSIRKQVVEAREIVAGLPEERIQSTRDINPNYQQLLVTLLTEQATIRGLQAQREELQSQQRAVREQLAELNGHERQLHKLQLAADLAEQNYRLYSEKLEQARSDDALDAQRISNINVFQTPTFEAEPTSPQLGLIGVFGLAFACFGGVGVCLVAESFDRRFARAEQVEQQLELPVLVSVPRVTGRRVLLN